MSEQRPSLADALLSVSFPKKLVIQNRRLGILFRILQGIFVVLMIIYFILQEPWRTAVEPVGNELVIWCSRFNASTHRALQRKHCKHPHVYRFDGDGDFAFRPSSCKPLPTRESCSEGGRDLFVSTFVHDASSWEGAGSACGSLAEGWCRNRTGFTYTVDRSSGRCSCTTQEQYFVESPEAQTLFVLHGYQVDLTGGTSSNTRVIRGSVAHGSIMEVSGDLKVLPGQLVTRIQTPSGDPCSVGGKSTWTEADARSGIGGTLTEWLACAGINLDAPPNLLAPVASLPPHLRTMGLTLNFRVDYRNKNTDSFDYVDCRLTVVATASWTRRTRADTLELPDFPHGESQVLMRRHVAYGVAVELTVGGLFWTYSIEKALSFIVQLIVILQLPLFVVEFVALYCLGILSEIYRSAKRTQLNVFKAFHSAMARMLLAEIGFRGLMGGEWEGSVLKLSLSQHGVLGHLTDVFGEQIKAGMLQMEELKRMVAVTFGHIDTNGNGTISCGEFIHLCMSGELITVPTMAKFFDDDVPVGPLRLLLDSNWHERKEELAKWKRQVEETMTEELGITEPEAEEPKSNTRLEATGPLLYSGERAADVRTVEVSSWRQQLDNGVNGQMTQKLDALEQRLVALEKQQLEKRVEDLELDEEFKRGSWTSSSEVYVGQDLSQALTTVSDDLKARSETRTAELEVAMRREVHQQLKEFSFNTLHEVQQQLNEYSRTTKQEVDQLRQQMVLALGDLTKQCQDVQQQTLSVQNRLRLRLERKALDASCRPSGSRGMSRSCHPTLRREDSLPEWNALLPHAQHGSSSWSRRPPASWPRQPQMPSEACLSDSCLPYELRSSGSTTPVKLL